MAWMVRCPHRLHRLADSAPSLLCVSCTERCAGQGYPATFVVRFLSWYRKVIAQFIAVCSASILAEKLCMSSLLSGSSLENKGASSRPARAYICQLQPTTSSDKVPLRCG